MLDNRMKWPVRSLAREAVTTYGRFFPAGAGAPAVSDSPDKTEAGWSVTSRLGVGQYRITFNNGAVPKIIGFKVSLVQAAPSVNFTACEITSVASAGTLDFAVFLAGVAVDYAALATTFFRIEVVVRNTAVNP